MFKSLVLYWEESFDAFILQHLYHFLIFDEVGELAFFWELIFLYFDRF